MFHCYVLRSQKTGRRYVGSCESLPRRLHRHNTGQMKATKHGVPWILIQSESFATRREAVQRELYYKTGRGRDDLNTFVWSGRRGDRSQVQILSPRFLACESALATSAATTIRGARGSRVLTPVRLGLFASRENEL